jgi:glycosyltransferase involved in cell wall biosynthesis
VSVAAQSQRQISEPAVVVWGTYDLGKPRVRILLQAAREQGIPLREIHFDVWRGIEDKSRITGFWTRLRYLSRWLWAYPLLLLRYLFTAKHQLVFVPYMGHLDVILLRPLARLRGARIVWDALLSLHGTLVEDRALVAPQSIYARIINRWDRLAFACADQLITGTQARAVQYVKEYGVDPGIISAIPVATELATFGVVADKTGPGPADGQRPLILFYGQFAPLHGLPTVLQVAISEAGRQWDWVFVGTGQEGWRIGEMMEQQSPGHIQWLEWIPYEELPAWICRADLCFGTFGTSQKARTGISNKIFQILACGRPLVTADTPAIRELLAPDMPGVYLVPAQDPAALSRLLQELLPNVASLRAGTFHQQLADRMAPAALGRQLAAVFHRALSAPPRENTGL